MAIVVIAALTGVAAAAGSPGDGGQRNQGGRGNGGDRTQSSLPIYLNPSYTAQQRAVDLVSRMTLQEKASQMISNIAPAIPRLGVAAWGWWNEANHGVLALTNSSSNPPNLDNTTSYPTDLSLGSTWNSSLVYGEATQIGDEAREVVPNNRLNLDFYAPTVNLSRDPRWGRNDETWGEDPTLTGDLASQYVDGLQGETPQGVLPKSAHGYYKAIATLKHYAANNSEVNRLNGNSAMDERTLHEYYTAQFADIIQQAHPGAIMSSYNEVNGVPAPADVQLIDTMARESFGFTGYFTSDCDAIFEIENGHKWQPPGAPAPLDQFGRAAYANSAGEDLECNGGFRDQFNYSNTVPQALGMGIPTQTDTYNVGDVDTSLVRLFTARIATGEFDSESRVPWVARARAELGGVQWVNSDANMAETETPARLAEDRAVADQSIVLLKNDAPAGSSSPLLPLKVPHSGPYTVDVMGFFANPPGAMFLGGYSSTQLASGQAKEIKDYQGIKTAIQAIDPDATVNFLPGVTGGTTAATLNTVDAASIQAAASADAVIVVAGTDASTSAESMDRANLELPGAQASMISQAEAANPNTIVYLDTVGDVNLTSFESTTPALLWSSYNGEEGGGALADVLTGKVDATGRLPFTWYTDESQLAPITDYGIRPTATNPGRTYMYFTGTPSFPFGFGLSYTKFAYSHIHANHRAISANGTVTVTARVTNTGHRTGSTVAQLYATTPFEPASAQRPIKRLEAFQKVSLRPGQSQEVTFRVPALKLAFWSETENHYVVDPGQYGFEISTSSADSDIQLRTTVGISGTVTETPSVVNAKPIETGDQANGVAQRIFFDDNTTIDPQLTVGMNDQQLYGYVTKGQSTPLPAGLKVSYRSSNTRAVRVFGDTIRTVGSGIATVTAKVRYHGVSASTSFTVDVAQLEFTSDPSTVFQEGTASTFTVTTDANPTAKLTESGALPAGVTFTDNGDGTATLAGTPPDQTGTFPVTITASNGVSPTMTQKFTLSVGTQPAITSGNSAVFSIGAAGTDTVTTTGFPTTAITESGTLPAGVTFTDNGDGTATLSGTPASGSQGAYPLTITASNGLTPATQTLALTVLANLPTATTAVMTGTTSETFTFGTFSFTFPLAGATVHLVPVGSTTDAVPAATSDGNGFYEFDNVPPGSYQVEFVDQAFGVAGVWFNGTPGGSPTQAGASTVTLTAGQATTGISGG